MEIPKKGNEIRKCMDFKDLNRGSLKEKFPLPHVDMLADNASKKSTYSFIDEFLRYNQIKMVEEDKEKTSFITPRGTLCYKVMSFSLKIIWATYQRSMVTLFHDMMYIKIEAYIDDMIPKI